MSPGRCRGEAWTGGSACIPGGGGPGRLTAAALRSCGSTLEEEAARNQVGCVL